MCTWAIPMRQVGQSKSFVGIRLLYCGEEDVVSLVERPGSGVRTWEWLTLMIWALLLCVLHSSTFFTPSVILIEEKDIFKR
jgi:hypothetical protein